MQPSVREELYVLREMAAQLLKRLERLEQMLEQQAREPSNMELTPEEEFRQKFPNLPVPSGLRRKPLNEVNRFAKISRNDVTQFAER